MHSSIIALLPVLPAVLSHGLITSPPSRPVGPAIIANCGPKVEQDIRLDNTSHVEGLPELAAKDSMYNPMKCKLWQCKGLQFADNMNNTQTWTAGQVIPIKVWIRIPHEGSANVSIVDTKSDTIIGEMLKVWSSGDAPGKKESDVPLDQEEFSVTVPEGLEEKCAIAGDCVSHLLCFSMGKAFANMVNRSCNGGGMELLLSRHMNRAWTSRSRRRV